MRRGATRHAARLLTQRDIAWLGARRACRIDANAIAFKNGAPLSFDACLVSTGGKHALATWGRWSWSGNWVWRLKDRIDRAFMRQFGTMA